jgi:hypothetical protein
MSIAEYGISRTGISGVFVAPSSPSVDPSRVLNPFRSVGDPNISPAIDFIQITSFGDFDLINSATGEAYVARGLLCLTDGLATIVTVRGYTRANIPLIGMKLIPVGARRILSFSGTGLSAIL